MRSFQRPLLSTSYTLILAWAWGFRNKKVEGKKATFIELPLCVTGETHACDSWCKGPGASHCPLSLSSDFPACDLPQPPCMVALRIR